MSGFSTKKESILRDEQIVSEKKKEYKYLRYGLLGLVMSPPCEECQTLLIPVDHSMPMVSLNTPWKYQEIFNFLIFLGF